LAEARQSYSLVLEDQPKSVEAVVGLARIDQLSGRPEQAEAGFRRALELSPGSALAQNAIGQFYVSREQWPQALPLLKSAADAEPGTPRYAHHYAVALTKSGRVEEGFQVFRQAVGEAEAHYNVGFLLREQGDTAAAEQRFHQALRLNPDLEPAAFQLAELTGQPLPTRVEESPAVVHRPRVTEIRQTGADVLGQPGSSPVQNALHVEPSPTAAAQPSVVPRWRREPLPSLAATTSQPPSPPAATSAPAEWQGKSSRSDESRWHSHAEWRSREQTPTAAPVVPSQFSQPTTTQTPAVTPQQLEQWRNQGR
jgi:thioredoxin-like negative regulator of GroEL